MYAHSLLCNGIHDQIICIHSLLRNGIHDQLAELYM
jgi:hypothetical protein